MPIEIRSVLNRRARTKFREGRRLIGAGLALVLLVGIGLVRPHVHAPDGTPAESCAVCHAARDPMAPASPELVVPSAPERREAARPADAPRPVRAASLLRARSRAPPA